MYTEVHPILYSSAGYLGVTTSPTIRPNDGQDPAGSALEVGAFSVDAGKDNVAALSLFCPILPFSAKAVMVLAVENGPPPANSTEQC